MAFFFFLSLFFHFYPIPAGLLHGECRDDMKDEEEGEVKGMPFDSG
jgi:hypothetical protein